MNDLSMLVKTAPPTKAEALNPSCLSFRATLPLLVVSRYFFCVMSG